MPPDDERLRLAYDAGVQALAQQDLTLNGLRTRTTGLLSAAAIVTSFSAGLGLLRTDPEAGPVFPHWAAFSLLAILVVIGVSSLVVAWPVPRFSFGPDSDVILEKTSAGEGMESILSTIAKELGEARAHNAGAINLRLLFYRVGLGLLVAEVIVLVIALSYR